MIPMSSSPKTYDVKLIWMSLYNFMTYSGLVFIILYYITRIGKRYTIVIAKICLFRYYWRNGDIRKYRCSPKLILLIIISLLRLREIIPHWTNITLKRDYFVCSTCSKALYFTMVNTTRDHLRTSIQFKLYIYIYIYIYKENYLSFK